MRFGLRDLFWLTAVVGLAVDWWLDHQQREELNISTQVLVVAGSHATLAEIGVGRDDGLARGDVLRAYRGTSLMGQVTVIAISPDKAVVQLDKSLGGACLRKGDSVSGRIPKRHEETR